MKLSDGGLIHRFSGVPYDEFQALVNGMVSKGEASWLLECSWEDTSVLVLDKYRIDSKIIMVAGNRLYNRTKQQQRRHLAMVKGGKS